MAAVADQSVHVGVAGYPGGLARCSKVLWLRAISHNAIRLSQTELFARATLKVVIRTSLLSEQDKTCNF